MLNKPVGTGLHNLNTPVAEESTRYLKFISVRMLGK